MKINKERVEFYLKHIREGGHFEINLCRYGSEMTDKLSKAIISRIVKPIWDVQTESMLFGFQRKTRAAANSSRVVLKQPSSETRLEHDERLWGRILEGKEGDKNWILCVSEKNTPLFAIAENSWDPQYVTNLTAVASKASLEFCRERVQGENQCCFLFYRSAMGVSMSIHAHNEILEKLYTTCVEQCRFTGKGLEKELRG
jgi:hypothetical protein